MCVQKILNIPVVTLVFGCRASNLSQILHRLRQGELVVVVKSSEGGGGRESARGGAEDIVEYAVTRNEKRM